MSLLAALRPDNTRTLVISLIEGVAFSGMLVLGWQLDTWSYLDVSAVTALALLAGAVVFSVACLAANQALARRAERASLEVERGSRAASKVFSEAGLDRRWFIGCCIALGVVWLAWYLVLFPGVYGYDAPFWYLEWDDPSYKGIWAQWSLPYSWLFHAFVRFGSDAFGSYEIGFACFIVLQACIVYYAAVRMLRYLWFRFGSRAGLVCSTLFLGFSLPLVLVVFSSAQDTLFIALLCLVVVNLFEMLDDPEHYWSHKMHAVTLGLVVLLLCLTRNNGLYIMLVTLPFIAFYARGHRRQLLITLAVPLFVFALYQWPVLNALPVEKVSSVSEMGSIPLQQMARVYCFDKDSMTDEEVELLETYVPPETLETYWTYPSVSDQLKGDLEVDEVISDPARFVRLYVSLGVRDPVLYTEAALLQNLGLWYPGKTYPDSRMWHPYVESEVKDAKSINERFITIDDMSVFPEVDGLVQHLFGIGEEHFDETPVIGLLGRSAPYFWLLLFATGFAIVARRPRVLLALAPLLALELTVVLGPLVLFRYIAPVVFATPLVVASLVGAGRGAAA